MSLQTKCQRLVSTSFFSKFSLGMILISAAIMGVETVDSVMAQYGAVLKELDRIILAWFALEIFLRIAAYGRNIGAFFKFYLYGNDGFAKLTYWGCDPQYGTGSRRTCET